MSKILESSETVQHDVLASKSAQLPKAATRSDYFIRMALRLVNDAIHAANRVRRWNTRSVGLFILLPSIYLIREYGTYTPYKYRLGVQFGFWGIDVGFIQPKRLRAFDPGEREFVPDEANERA